jgi:predicted SnoaL-like aldol condensation-catalyzing enzyme
MVDGPTDAADLGRTEANRSFVRELIEDVLIARRIDRLDHYVDSERFTQHNPELEDGISALKAELEAVSGDRPVVEYERLHRVLAEGSFVLSVSEGFLACVHSSFYDLFRVAEGKVVEHWDTIEAVPAPSEWKNENGKF